MKRPVFIVLLASAMLATGLECVIPASGNVPSSSANSPQQKPKADDPKADGVQSIEQQRLDLDRQKYVTDSEVKKEELRIQQSQKLWTAISTVIPFIAVLLTVGYSAWSFRQQTRQLNEQRREDAEETNNQRAEDAKLQFELKSAEIAFKAETPLAVGYRAKALKAMFAGRLPDNFLSNYDPFDFGEREGNLESKKFFLELLLRYPDQQFETLCFWKELFPGDVEWLNRVHLSPHERPVKSANAGDSVQETTRVREET
jgi:type II secretory pathway component PulL